MMANQILCLHRPIRCPKVRQTDHHLHPCINVSAGPAPASGSKPNAKYLHSSLKPKSSKLPESSSRWIPARELTRWTAGLSSRPRWLPRGNSGGTWPSPNWTAPAGTTPSSERRPKRNSGGSKRFSGMSLVAGHSNRMGRPSGRPFPCERHQIRLQTALATARLPAMVSAAWYGHGIFIEDGDRTYSDLRLFSRARDH